MLVVHESYMNGKNKPFHIFPPVTQTCHHRKEKKNPETVTKPHPQTEYCDKAANHIEPK